MKKLRNLFLALVLVLVSVFTVSVSADTATGTITVNNAEAGRKYDVFKIFDLTRNGTKVAYTIDSDWVNFFFNDVEGKGYIVESNSGSLNQVTHEGKTYYINITESNVKEFAQKALVYAAKNVDAETDSKTAKVGETLVFEGLALGYYLVYPHGATEKNDAQGSIASLDSTMPNAEVNIKATYPELHKVSTNGNNFDVGEYASFKITGKVPDTTGFQKYTYEINDSWYDGLELDESKLNLIVKIGTKEIKDYILKLEKDRFVLSIDMTKYQSEIGKEVTVTYDLLVNKTAINSSISRNEAFLRYSTNPKNADDKTETPKEIVYVYSSKIVVTKIDGVSKEKLANATFVLMKGNQYYNVDEKGFVTWVNNLDATENEKGATRFTTKEDGVITFAGIRDGDYKLVEVEAPAGYNKLPQPVDVTVNGTTIDQQTGVPTSEATTKTVENNTGVELPSTGGFGTKLFIIIGSLLAMISGVVLVTNKRMAKEEM